MSELAEDVKQAAKGKVNGTSPARAAAEHEAETELLAALEKKDVKRIRAAFRALRELDDD